MSKLSEMLKIQEEKPHQKLQGMEIDLSGNCTICFLDVDEATYYPEHFVLKYTCENGHTNYLEDFRL